MLQGASTYLDMNKKQIWLIEICVSEHQPNGIEINPNLLSTFELFWKRGYVALSISDNLKIVEKHEIKKIAKTGIDTLGGHNFLIVEENLQSSLLKMKL